MFDVGFWEILLILVLALLVIGPERLPGAARKAGYFVGKARRYIEGVRSEVESELNIDEFKRILHNQEVQINELQHKLQTGAAKVQSDVTEEVSVTNALDDFSTQPFHDELVHDHDKAPVHVNTPVHDNAETDELMEKKSEKSTVPSSLNK